MDGPKCRSLEKWEIGKREIYSGTRTHDRYQILFDLVGFGCFGINFTLGLSHYHECFESILNAKTWAVNT